MRAEASSTGIHFWEGERLAGLYVLDDPFKPHFAVLNTPAGHNVAVVSPPDHRHHKGLMYALRCADLNFWEEDPGTGECGVQQILSTTLSDSRFAQEILWREESGGLATYREQRTITCRSAPETRGFEWCWHTRRESLRNHLLVKSPWSAVLPDGRSVNYHGLGLRMPWAWAYPDDSIAGFEDGSNPADASQVMGSSGPEMTMWGLMDGQWSPSKCAVTVRQTAGYTWFGLRQPFAYLAVGPSNAHDINVRAGDLFDETYTITVADRQPLLLCV